MPSEDGHHFYFAENLTDIPLFVNKATLEADGSDGARYALDRMAASFDMAYLISGDNKGKMYILSTDGTTWVEQ